MPFLTGPLLEWFAALAAEAAVARLGEHLQPFPGIYSQAHLPTLIEAMTQGRSLQAALRSLGAVELGEAALREFGDPRRLCFSVNGRKDLARAARRMGDDTLDS
jgi:molybdopterin-guanine dinucleotide biosynthesis protein A